jgi:hypothetical protein
MKPHKKLPNGIPPLLHSVVTNGGLMGERQKFLGYYEIIGAYTHDGSITYSVKLYHSDDYQEIVDIHMDAFDKN